MEVNMGNMIFSGPQRTNLMNSIVFLSLAQLNALADDAREGTLVDAFQKEWSEWTNSLIYFPFSSPISKAGVPKLLSIGLNDNVGNGCYEIPEPIYGRGFTLGEWKHTPVGNFTDFEPYTNIQAYLPFYGYISLKVADIYNKYVQFRLSVDFHSGQATYYVGVTEDSGATYNANAPFRSNYNFETSIRIIATYSCQIGYPIAYGQSGASEAIRNITLGLVKGAAVIGGAAVAGAVGAGVAVTTTSTAVDYSSTSKIRNPQTGRQVTKGSVVRHDESVTTETVNRNTWRGDVVNGCFNTAANAIANANISPQFDRSNSPFSDSIGATKVTIIIKKVNIKEIDAEYSHLYGQPLGETKVLSAVHGYTECSAVHFEGENFGSATSEELKLITQFMSSGVILP